MSENFFFSNSVVNYINFLKNEKPWTVPLGKRKLVLSTVLFLLPKSWKLFDDSWELFMKLYNLKQFVFLKSMLWSCRKQLCQFWRKCSSKSKKIVPRGREMIIKVLKKYSVPARYLLDNWTSVSTTPQKSLQNSEKVLISQLRWTLRFFPKSLFFKGPSGGVNCSYDKLDENFLSVEV